jgi:hypothetical protein
MFPCPYSSVLECSSDLTSLDLVSLIFPNLVPWPCSSGYVPWPCSPDHVSLTMFPWPCSVVMRESWILPSLVHEKLHFVMLQCGRLFSAFSIHTVHCKQFSIYVFPRMEEWNFSSTGDSYKDGPLKLLFPFLLHTFGIWDWDLTNSFWDHVIQISIRQMSFKYIFSQLWKVKIFCVNIYSLSSNCYFRGTVLCV